MHAVRLVVIGAPAVGKTSLIEVLVSHSVQPLKPLVAANEGHVYNITTLFDGVIYCITVLELPPAAYLRPDMATAASKLASADAYLLVFDLTSSATFQYIKVLRDQLFDGRHMSPPPVFVVGNKADCMPAGLCRAHCVALPHQEHSQHHHHHHFPHSHHEPPVAFKDLAALVRKQWKWAYIEVSALHDWHVQALFYRVLEAVSHSRHERHEQDNDSALTRPQPHTSPQSSCRLL